MVTGRASGVKQTVIGSAPGRLAPERRPRTREPIPTRRSRADRLPSVPARPRTLVVPLPLAALLALALVAAPAGAATLRVGTARNATLGERILVTGSGLSLYTLSAETRGRFVCTDASCLGTWPPLLLRGGATPTGVRSLGAIRRPDGRRQVTYRGRPLYRFAGDARRGDVEGEGFRDVGTWHVALAPTR